MRSRSRLSLQRRRQRRSPERPHPHYCKLTGKISYNDAWSALYSQLAMEGRDRRNRKSHGHDVAKIDYLDAHGWHRGRWSLRAGCSRCRRIEPREEVFDQLRGQNAARAAKVTRMKRPCPVVKTGQGQNKPPSQAARRKGKPIA